MKCSTKINTPKKNLFLSHYEKHLGNISRACADTGIDRKTFYNWIKCDANFKNRVDELNEKNIDIVEGALMQQIQAGNTTATIFFLKTKGKNRGYVERHDVEFANREPIIFTTTPEIKDLIDKL
ncbi:MAG: helix-turn-helix domain-containing protein [Paludibacteraceae bacterium]|nr:helix-turn-helix domain-containing protein [Paludibacteraceae bacterium]